eukprot:5959346-Prorocentrum_lima.AAC.1
MNESWRPEHFLDDPMTLMEDEGTAPMTGRRGRRICPMCELRYRKEEWPKLREEEKVDNPNYCTFEQ